MNTTRRHYEVEAVNGDGPVRGRIFATADGAREWIDVFSDPRAYCVAQITTTRTILCSHVEAGEPCGLDADHPGPHVLPVKETTP